MTDESLTLEQRVASLEEALLHPLLTIQAPPHDFTEREAAEFRRELKAALENGPHELRVIPPRPPLTRDQVRPPAQRVRDRGEAGRGADPVGR